VTIFEGFEPESDDDDEEEEEEEEGDDDDDDEQGGEILTEEERRRIEKLAIQDFPDDEPFEPAGKPGSDELDTGVQTSQLRHFVIQVIPATC